MELELLLTEPSSDPPHWAAAFDIWLIPLLPGRWSVPARHERNAHCMGLIPAPAAPGRARSRCTPATLFAGRVHKRRGTEGCVCVCDVADDAVAISWEPEGKQTLPQRQEEKPHLKSDATQRDSS